MRPLRTPSDRPAIIVDDAGRATVEPGSTPLAVLGRPGPFGRERVVFALPLDPGPMLLEPALMLRDQATNQAADPPSVIVGWPALRVARMLTAATVEDTRRLS